MPGSRECPVPSPVTHVEIRCALGGTSSESASIPGEKSSYLFNIPDVPLCNIIVGILDTKRSLLDRWRTLAICWKLLKTAFFCKSHATSLPAVCRVLGNVRQLHPKEPGLYQSLPQLSSQLWYFLQQKNRENSPMNTWDRGTTNCCPIITQTSSAQVKQGCEKTHPEVSPLLSSRGKSEHRAGFGECPGDPSNLLQLCPQTGHGGVQRLLWAHYQRASQHSRG